jgi:two-component system response regulator MprA
MTQSAPNRILLVEDERDLSAVIVQWLTKGSYAVDTAFDGLEALEKIQATAYDLIILDIMLPYVDGIEIFRRAREHGRTAPILFLTACPEASKKTAKLVTGSDSLMTKPFKLRELSSKLSQMLKFECFGNSTRDTKPIKVAVLA